MKYKSLLNKMMGTICGLSLIVASHASRADDIAIGYPINGGNGCPQGSASAVLSDDLKTLTILFDSFSANAGLNVGKQLDRKSCNVAIPIHVPAGISVSILSVDYRGFVGVPAGGMARFMTEYFLAGSRGPISSRVFRGPQDTDYLISNRLSAVAWTPCGLDTNLRINASMLAQSNRRGDDVLATVDSIDLNAGMVFHLQTRSCF